MGAGGAIVGLPLLEGLMPRTAKAAAGPTFLYAFSHAYGVSQGVGRFNEQFWPAIAPASGTATAVDAAALNAALAAGRSTGELASIAQHVSFLRGVDNLVTTGDVGHHENGYCQTFTGSAFRRLRAEDHTSPRPLSEDLSQRVARELGGLSPLNLMGCGDGGNQEVWIARASDLTGTFSPGGGECTPEPLEAYKRIFHVDVPAELLNARHSVNDQVLAQLTSLKASSRLSKSDQVRLELHFDAIRAVEQRIQQQLACGSLANTDPLMKYVLTSGDFKLGEGAYDDVARYRHKSYLQQNQEAMIDLSVLALACGATRAVRFFSNAASRGNKTDMFDPGSSEFNNGMAKEMHDYSHQLTGPGDNADTWNDRLRRHDAWHLRRFKRVVEGLKTHNILDNGVAMYFSEQGNGDHSMTNIPFILAGNCGGKLQNGKVIAANCKNNKLLATVGAALGLKDGGSAITQFGGLYEDGQKEPGGYIEALKTTSFGT